MCTARVHEQERPACPISALDGATSYGTLCRSLTGRDSPPQILRADGYQWVLISVSSVTPELRGQHIGLPARSTARRRAAVPPTGRPACARGPVSSCSARRSRGSPASAARRGGACPARAERHAGLARGAPGRGLGDRRLAPLSALERFTFSACQSKPHRLGFFIARRVHGTSFRNGLAPASRSARCGSRPPSEPRAGTRCARRAAGRHCGAAT
jgi:hypothetical protein